MALLFDPPARESVYVGRKVLQSGGTRNPFVVALFCLSMLLLLSGFGECGELGVGCLGGIG